MSHDGPLLNSQCKRQPSHLEVTEWDLYQPALDILAVVFYTFVRRKWSGRRSCEEVEGLVGCGSENQKEFSLLPCVFYEEPGANVIGQPTRRSGPHSDRISLVSIKMRDVHMNVHEHV